MTTNPLDFSDPRLCIGEAAFAASGTTSRDSSEYEALEQWIRRLETEGPAAVDWPEVVRLATTILEARGKDLVVGCWLAYGLFHAETELRGASFPRVMAKRFSVQGSDLTGATFERARLDTACFVNVLLAEANLTASSLKRAILSRNTLTAAEFSFANLWEAQLNRADLRGACFACANLYGADLSDARLTGADLAGANLGRTVLELASDG